MIAIAAIIKNEAPFLDEWLAFHFAQGFDHFFIYDNGSTDATAEILAKWADVVTVHRWPIRPGQFSAYQHAIDNHARACEWIAFLDADEFLYSPTGKTVAETLPAFADHGGVAVNWICFGTSGHETRPPGLVIENFTLRQPDDFPANRHVKSIMRGDCVRRVLTAHHYQSSKPVVTERGETITGPMSLTVSADLLRVNHYFTRSLTDWREKLARRRSDTDARRLDDEWELYDGREVVDAGAARYAEAVKGECDAGIRDKANKLR